MEKPPKPPKTSITSTETSNDNLKAVKQDKNSRDLHRYPVQTNIAARGKSSAGHSQDINVVDMTGIRDDNEYDKIGLRAYKNLHRLHQKVNKPAPTRIFPSTKPKFSYAGGDQPRLSFLSETSNASRSADPISSDYGDEWIDDLPSTSALLAQRAQVEKISATATSQPAATPSRAKALESTGNTVEDFGSQSGLDVSDLEAAVVRKDDSRAMTNQTFAEGETQDGASPKDCDWPIHEIEQANKRRSQGFSSPAPFADHIYKNPSREERLFLSTDSVDKPSSVRKRQHTMADHHNPSDAAQEPAEKRRKPTEAREDEEESSKASSSIYETTKSDQTLEASASEVNQISALQRFSNGGKPIPGWARDFDPSFMEWFLTEYGHVVELV